MLQAWVHDSLGVCALRQQVRGGLAWWVRSKEPLQPVEQQVHCMEAYLL